MAALASIPPILLQESVYPTQQILTVESALPVMQQNSHEIPQNRFSVIGMIPTSNLKRSSGYLMWSNDADDSLSKTNNRENTPMNTCSLYLKPDQNPEDKYNYYCRLYLFGYTPTQRPNPDDFDFMIRPPRYTPIPYEYVHMVRFMNREMNIHNMYISDMLAELLEREYVRWLTRKFSGLLLKRNSKSGFDGLGQLIHQPFPTTKQHGDLKIQMRVYPRYFCWVLETILLHIHEFYACGLQSFKFMFLHGEDKLINMSEIYPTIEPGQTLEEYTVMENGKPTQYKREQLFMPNIVFYLLDAVGNNAKPIMDLLVRLFPDEFELSCYIPRANIRVSNNVSFSVGGGNVDKYDNPALQHVPLEYGKIINTPALHSSHKMFSRYLTGHTIINDDLTVNNIASYKLCVAQYKSFKSIFEQYNLMEYYMGICAKLRIDEAVMNSVTGGKSKKSKKQKQKQKSKRR
jgi:hypothetical protein